MLRIKHFPKCVLATYFHWHFPIFPLTGSNKINKTTVHLTRRKIVNANL